MSQEAVAAVESIRDLIVKKSFRDFSTKNAARLFASVTFLFGLCPPPRAHEKYLSEMDLFAGFG
jgi:hypothetical protein